MYVSEMGDETKEERQDNEYAALESIFGDAVSDNRGQNAWKVWRPLDLMLTLHPLHNSNVQGVHCSVTLHITCCPNYPDKPPDLKIHKMHGLSTENATKLLDELDALAQQLCGEVMIFELAQHAQQFLHDHNKPTLSFYEEMLKQKTEMEQLKLHDMQVKEDEERKKIKDEIQRREDILKAAGRQRIHRSSASQENSTDGLEAPELVYYADKATPIKTCRSESVSVACTCNIKSAQVVRVTQRNNKKVYVGNCLGHSSNGSTTYLAIDDETGERLITKKWLLPPATDFQTRSRQLNSIQQDLKNMCRITKSTLLPYTAMEMSKETTKRTVKICIYIFRDFVLGTSLNYLRTMLKVYKDKYEALKLLRHVGLGVFSALKVLHEVGVVHRDVRSENVFLDDSGNVKLVGASLDMRLSEMMEGEDYCDRQTKTQDIYASALMLLSIVSQDSAVLEVPSDLPSSAKDFLSRCLTEEEHSQWSAEQLVNHGFLVDTPVIQPTTSHKDDVGSGSEDEDPVKRIQRTSLQMNGHSRLNAEFEVLTWLGKGAFGDVLKVKNKLDGGFYAIKRIQLNPENVNLNKKITREVKLLSRLNHENVVRYYNAWIESSVEVSECPSEEKTPTRKRPGLSLEGVVAKLGQEVKVEWSMSEGIVQKCEDSEDEDPWFNGSPEDESSDDIEFEDLSNKSETIPSENMPDAPTRPPSERLKQVLYIQMEFCEKNTLRHAIDNGLFKEHYRAWRLFREIVEGLAHVHQRGMIHRDLKPVNIFLDSNDHVKIGDFGLATKAFSGMPVDDRSKQEEISGSLTGQIGTALYVAPELLQSASKVIYNQKVDIYSLGIILFEMFHPPLSTGMERMVVLTNLRTKDIVMPEGFECEDNEKQIIVIRWLLNHDASVRPTCAELLSSSHVPRPVAEGALSGLLSHTLSSRGSRGYQRLIGACLQQAPSTAEDITYHNGMRRVQLRWLTDRVAEVFRSHGAVEFSPPLLTPRVKAWDAYPNAVKVMTASGTVCHLPHDLRLPFARHVAYSGSKYMRRYVIDRVFREKHVPGFHPREIIECAFDIFNPKSDTLWPDAELLVVASRAASESGLKVTIHLNHTELLKALLMSCGVPLDKHADIYPILVDVTFGRITSLQLQTHLTSLCITNRDVSNLLGLMEADIAVYEVKELVTRFVKQAKWAKLVAQAVAELEAVYRNAKALGCDCPITVAPFLAYNATQHSGVFWQMSIARDERHTKRRAGDLIAAGGRYDALVEEFRKIARTKDIDSAKQKSSCVGFSMSLERMATIVKKMESEMPHAAPSEPTLICVNVHGTAGNGRDGLAASQRANLARDLWASGLSCCPCPNTVDRENSGAGIILEHEDSGVKAAWYSGDRVLEFKVPYIDAVDFVKQKLNPETMRTPESSNSRLTYQNWNDVEKSNSPNISVTFITASEKMTKNSKRYCENSINTQLTSTLVNLGLQPFLSRVRCACVALACDEACVRALAARLAAPLRAQDVQNAIAQVIAEYPKRQKILEEAQEELININKQNSQSRSSDETQLYALYSIPDSLCRLIT
ncbi:eIF-2-alpha kinase GCN2 [Cydia splendana]|uniref:eIF-2-alpha kinase GCN2 n=1 Tax=Cydia splendana TaxID=1100963 RepID=UPI0028F4AAE7